MNTYLNNQYPDVSLKYSKGIATFTVPDDVQYLSKSDMKAYVKPIYDRLETFAGANDMKSIPSIYMETPDGTPIARSTLTGFKVYADK